MFYDIAVVGFGLAGRLAALELSKQHRITVFEADDEHTQNSAGKVAAAMLDDFAPQLIALFSNSELTADVKMSGALEVDSRYQAWDSPRWAEACNVSDAAIRQTPTWAKLQDDKNASE